MFRFSFLADCRKALITYLYISGPKWILVGFGRADRDQSDTERPRASRMECDDVAFNSNFVTKVTKYEPITQ
jgi:hypothetical protein